MKDTGNTSSGTGSRSGDTRAVTADSLPSPGYIGRRAALRRIALMMGGTLSAPLVSGVLSGCGRLGDRYVPRTPTRDQYRFAQVVVDRIIPETNTPGALAARVHEFIDYMLTEWYPADARDSILQGLAAIEERAVSVFGEPFLDLDEAQQSELLAMFDAETVEARGDQRRGAPIPFFQIKELTLAGYYTSEIGLMQELEYSFIPERFDPCVPVDEIRPRHT